MNFLSCSVSILLFWLRVLFLAAIASPVLAQTGLVEEQDQSPPETFSETEASAAAGIGAVTAFIPEISAERLSQQPSAELPDHTTATSGVPNCWLVSSRRAVQSIHEKNLGPWHLDVYCSKSDGPAQLSSMADLATQLIPGVPVCIISHGSFVTWESYCQQSYEASKTFRRASGDSPLQVICFSWPSDGPYTHIPQVDVSVRGKRAEFNGFHLARLLSYVPESCPVTVIGHSHGSRVVLSAMHLTAGGSIQGFSFTGSVCPQRRMRVILAAGAMDHDWLNPGERYDLALNRVECLLNLRNQNDLPLAFYPLHRPFARRAIARAGLTQRDTVQLGWNSAKIRQVDVTNRLGPDHLWPDYYRDPYIMAAMIPYLISF